MNILKKVSIIVLLPLMLIMTGCAGQTATGNKGYSEIHPKYVAVSQLHSVTMDIAGDSVSALYYNGLPRAELSWVNWAVSSRVLLQGGFAVSGQRTDQIASGVRGQISANVLVVMAGTNDIRQHINPVKSMVYLDLIASEAGNTKPLFSLIPPSNGQPQETSAYNALLIAHAAAHGWTVVDPWVTIRQTDGTYKPGFTYDGTHPNGLGQRQSGPVIANAVFWLGNK